MFARTAIDKILEHEINPHEVVNLNIPICESEDMQLPKIKVVNMNTAGDLGTYDKRTSPDGRTYYWAAGSGMEFAHTTEGSDVEVLKEGKMTVTPLSFDLTDESRLGYWKEALGVT